MKTKNYIILICFIFLSSCALKALNPFYIASAIMYEKAFEGTWIDTKKGKWTITSMKDQLKNEKQENLDKEWFKLYEKGYYIQYTIDNKEAILVGMPFKVGNQLFMDFSPVDYDKEGLNNLVRSSIIETHTVAKFDILTNTKVAISWLDEEYIDELLEKNQIQIKHEKVGINESLVLTATSKELYKFLKKYIESNIEDKWGDIDYVLLKEDEKN